MEHLDTVKCWLGLHDWHMYESDRKRMCKCCHEYQVLKTVYIEFWE